MLFDLHSVVKKENSPLSLKDDQRVKKSTNMFIQVGQKTYRFVVLSYQTTRAIGYVSIYMVHLFSLLKQKQRI